MNGKTSTSHPQHEPEVTPPAGESPATPEVEPEGVLIDTLARLPDKAILDEARLAGALHVSRRTVRRMVSRFELPPPVSLAGRSVWLAGRVLRHIEIAVERAEREAERQARKIRLLTS